MSLKSTEAKLYHALYDFFDQEGYSLLIDKKQFRKTVSAGFVNVIFSVSEYHYDNDAWVEVHIGCRNDQIEQIAQQFLKVNLNDFRPDANTLIISIGRYNEVKYFRYKIQSEEDLVDTCEAIKEFMKVSGFPFLQTVCHLDEIDRLLNTHPNRPCKFLYNQIHRCFKGAIAARLTDNPHYQGIGDIYNIYVHKFGNEQEQLSYEQLLHFLQYYSAN
ncbi:MAG: hypothetical protein ACK4GN_08935 [Runella sp.]